MGGAEKQTAEHVLKALSEQPLRPKELVERLRTTSDERDVRRVVWVLLDRGAVALTHDRKLQATERAAEAVK